MTFATSNKAFWSEPRTQVDVKLFIERRVSSRQWRDLSERSQYDLLRKYPALTRAMRQSERRFFNKR